MQDPVDIDELRRLVGDYRRERGLSLRAAAEESGVPLNTLSRVEKGHLPDLANFGRLVTWVGLDPTAVFGATHRERPQSTTETIRVKLRSDPRLTEKAAEQIADLVSNLYANLAAAPADTRVSLRASKTFTPRGAHQIGDLLAGMHSMLRADKTLAAGHGWHEED